MKLLVVTRTDAEANAFEATIANDLRPLCESVTVCAAQQYHGMSMKDVDAVAAYRANHAGEQIKQRCIRSKRQWKGFFHTRTQFVNEARSWGYRPADKKEATMPEEPKTVVDESIKAEVVTPAPASTAIVVSGWAMSQFDGEDEPRILDVTLADRLGFSKPADIRKLIKRLDEQGKIPGVLRQRHVASTQMPTGGMREDTVEAYYLDEKNALRVIRRCETDKADDVMDEVISVYLAVKNGKAQPQRAMSLADSFRHMAQLAEDNEAMKAKQEKLAADNEAVRARQEEMTAEAEALFLRQLEQETATAEARRLAEEAAAKAEPLRNEIESIKAQISTRPMVQLETRAGEKIGEAGKFRILQAQAEFAVDCASTISPADWEDVHWLARLLWCDARIGKLALASIHYSGPLSELTGEQERELKQWFRQENKATVRKDVAGNIPDCYLARAKSGGRRKSLGRFRDVRKAQRLNVVQLRPVTTSPAAP